MKIENIDLFEFKNICMQMAELGAAALEKKREPINDILKQREAKRWLKSLGFEQADLDKMVANGLVQKIRIGKAKNSPVTYSKFEIQAAINSNKISKIINK